MVRPENLRSTFKDFYFKFGVLPIRLFARANSTPSGEVRGRQSLPGQYGPGEPSYATHQR